MSKSLTESLTALKPVLPDKYQETIAENLENIGISTVKRAFAGTLKDEAKLLRILYAAGQLARKHKEERERAIKETKKLLKEIS